MEDFNINVGLMEDKSDTEFIGILKSRCPLPLDYENIGWTHLLNTLSYSRDSSGGGLEEEEKAALHRRREMT